MNSGLEAVQGGVAAAGDDQLVMRAVLDEAPSIHSEDAVGAPHGVGIIGHHDGLSVPGLARGPLESLGCRMQIAGTTIDDRHGQRFAPGSGNKPMTSLPEGIRSLAAAGRDWLRNPAGTQAAKKRRSAASCEASLSRPGPLVQPTSLENSS